MSCDRSAAPLLQLQGIALDWSIPQFADAEEDVTQIFSISVLGFVFFRHQMYPCGAQSGFISDPGAQSGFIPEVYHSTINVKHAVFSEDLFDLEIRRGASDVT